MRRLLIVLIVLLVLAAVIVVGGTLVLRSAWLGERVLAAVSERLGLEVHAESFSLDWGGEATLGGVNARMPLRDEVVFSSARLRLGLSAVPWMILGRPIRVHAVELDHPTMFLWQSESGRWNAQEIWARVRAHVRRSSSWARRFRLPAVVVRDAAVQITARDGTMQTISPVAFEGRRQGQVLWTFDLQAPPLAEAAGQVVEGGDWAHEVRFHGKDLGPLVQDLFQQDLAPVRVAGRWNGAVRQDGVRGVVRLEDSAVGPVALGGRARVEVTPDRITIHPEGVTVRDPNFAGEPVQLMEGGVVLSRAGITLKSLTAQAGALGGRLDGHWDLGTRAGEFSGSWAAALPDASSQSSGTCQVSVTSPRAGRKEARAHVAVQARTPVGSGQTVADIRGSGAAWQTSQWQVQVPTLWWSRGERHVDMAGGAARIELSWPTIRLTSLSAPQANRASVDARIDVRTRQWSVRLAVEQWRERSLGANALDVRLDAEGNDREARVSELRVALGDSVAVAQGDLSLVRRGLQDVRVSADWPAHAPRSGPTLVQQPAGRWHLEAAVAGQILPVGLQADATLTGQSITLGKRLVDRVEIPVRVKMDTAQVEATTPPFDLLGGQWQLTGRYEFSGRQTGAHVMVTDLSLAAVASMVGLPPAAGARTQNPAPGGSLQGRAYAGIGLRMPGLDIRKAVAAGSWSARDVNIPPLVAQRAQGVLRIAGGSVRLEDIQLEQEGGRARADLNFRLDQPQVVSLDLEAHEWPVPWEGRPVTAVVDGQARLRTDIVKKTAEGHTRLTGRIVWQDREFADIRLTAQVQGQTLEVREFHAQALGGAADGTAVIPLNRWTDSVARLQWQGIVPGQLGAWLGPLERFQGTMSGSLVVEQARKADDGGPGTEDGGQRTEDGLPSSVLRPPSFVLHPLGPMRFVLHAELADGRFGPAEIDELRARGYLDSTRLLVEDSALDAFGGRLHARARFSRHLGKDYGSVVADFNDLNLDQVVHVLDPQAGPFVGRLSGNATVLPVLDRPISLAGEGWLSLTQSDLIGSGIVRTLYDTLNLSFGAQEPTGTGEVRVRFEGPAVVLSSAQYFNRGVEIRGAGRIANVNLGADSPVEGYAVGSTRILKGIKLPGVAALDRLLGVLQTGASSVRIGGVVDNVEVKVVPLPEVLDPFRRLLWAQLRE